MRAAIVGVCRSFIRFCREQSLFGGELLAIDGTKIAAVASRKQVITPKRIAKMNEAIDRKIAEYLAAMDEADRRGAERRPVAGPTWRRRLRPSRHNELRLQGQAEELAGGGSSNWW